MNPADPPPDAPDASGLRADLRDPDRRSDGARGAPIPPISRLALVSLGLNIPCFLPPFTLAAAILGTAALVRIVRAPRARSGSGFAIAAIVLGVLLTLICTPYWWTAGRLMLTGPQDAIHAAMLGDHDEVRSAFVGEGAAADDAEIDAFARELDSRFGPLIDARPERSSGEPRRRGRTWTVPYRLRFERQAVIAEVEITTWDPAKERSTLRLVSIRIPGEGAAPLRFPGASPTLPAP